MITAKARAMASASEKFKTVTIDRRDVGAEDVLIEIAYAGICHTDVHHARAEFGTTYYPIVPGHEIAGVVSAIGANVTRFSVGDHVGVGCLVDSCGKCDQCRKGLESYCRVNKVLTYNNIGRDGQVTLGGYSERVVVNEHFVARIPDCIPLQNAAPLLCAGVTVYSPLTHWGAGANRKRVAIVGFGGLGHVAVKIASALGAETTVINKTWQQADDARRFGAIDFRTTDDPKTYTDLADSFDLLVSTVPASYDLDIHLNLLAQEGVLVNLGVPEKPLSIQPYSLLTNRRSITGSMSGGMPVTQEMLDFCGENGIGAQVELIAATDIDEAFDRLVASDVRYRFVIDSSTLADA
jgi:alcohol dehydrogenase (NADP+)